MDAVIGAVYRDERFAEIAQGGFGGGSDVAFGHEDAHWFSIAQTADGMDAEGVAADAAFRLFRHLDFGDEVTGRWIQPGELDAGCLANETASAVAADEILRSQRFGRRSARR